MSVVFKVFLLVSDSFNTHTWLAARDWQKLLKVIIVSPFHAIVDLNWVYLRKKMKKKIKIFGKYAKRKCPFT